MVSRLFTMTLSVPISIGELIDKVTILEIKLRRIQDPLKQDNICNELRLLDAIVSEAKLMQNESLVQLKVRLSEVNAQLWTIEDDIREQERRKEFGPEFVQLARSVYLTNDVRAELKREINLLMGSYLVEEKSYCP
jgi:hypothetical protein